MRCFLRWPEWFSFAGVPRTAGALEISKNFHKFRRRFKHTAPKLFLVLVVLSLLSGCLYPPLNFDANAYRLPRVFHWLWNEQWHWIHTFDDRMNIAACGFEWLSAPLILFSHYDRLIFLINWISYLMLPGLIFSVFIRLQVRPRVAWWWMWFLSAGWCFALQASSAANDSFAAIYALASVDLALRAREKNSATDLWLSLLAAALATGAKQTNLPLVLLWVIAAWPCRRLFLARPLGTLLVIPLAMLVSVVPISVENWLHYGTWMPVNLISIAKLGNFHLNPFWGIVGNAFAIPAQNLLPPFYNLVPPLYSGWVEGWNDVMKQFLLTPFGSHFISFERFGFLSGVFYNGICDGNAGIGLGICILTFISVREALYHRKIARTGISTGDRKNNIGWLHLAPWGLLLLFMAKVGSFENARHLTPYYPFLFPLMLAHRGHSILVQKRWWRRLGLFTMVLTAAMIVTLSGRPLFPAKTIFKFLYGKFPENKLVRDEYTGYCESIYQILEGRRNYLKTALPPSEKVIGVDMQDEPGVWLPFGKRANEYLLLMDVQDSCERMRKLGIHYCIVHRNGIAWITNYNGVVVGQYTIPTVFHPIINLPDLYIVHVDPNQHPTTGPSQTNFLPVVQRQPVR